MTIQETQSGAYCSDLASRADEDRWLALQYASVPLKDRLLALYALQIELRRIPGAVSEPPLGEIRLQWWREALEEIREGKTPRAHPVVEAIAAAGLADPAYSQALEAVIDAAAAPLYGEVYGTAQELKDWLRAAEGGFDALAVRLAGGNEALAQAAGEAGAAFALAREGAGIAPKLADEARALAKDLYADQKAVLAAAPAEVSPALLHLALTPAYIRRGAKAFPARKRLALFAAMAVSKF